MIKRIKGGVEMSTTVAGLAVSLIGILFAGFIHSAWAAANAGQILSANNQIEITALKSDFATIKEGIRELKVINLNNQVDVVTLKTNYISIKDDLKEIKTILKRKAVLD